MSMKRIVWLSIVLLLGYSYQVMSMDRDVQIFQIERDVTPYLDGSKGEAAREAAMRAKEAVKEYMKAHFWGMDPRRPEGYKLRENAFRSNFAAAQTARDQAIDFARRFDRGERPIAIQDSRPEIADRDRVIASIMVPKHIMARDYPSAIELQQIDQIERDIKPYLDGSKGLLAREAAMRAKEAIEEYNAVAYTGAKPNTEESLNRLKGVLRDHLAAAQTARDQAIAFAREFDGARR